ncbi:MAG: protein kinase [Vicinamibacteria bacterium]
MPLKAGSRFGAYEIRGSLGAGGMGEVYRAHDPRLGRDVALKTLPESMSKNAESLARFEREARAVAALNHPHIVTIYSTEESDGVRFMTMELIEAQTLSRLIPKDRTASTSPRCARPQLQRSYSTANASNTGFPAALAGRVRPSTYRRSARGPCGSGAVEYREYSGF